MEKKIKWMAIINAIILTIELLIVTPVVITSTQAYINSYNEPIVEKDGFSRGINAIEKNIDKAIIWLILIPANILCIFMWVANIGSLILHAKDEYLKDIILISVGCLLIEVPMMYNSIIKIKYGVVELSKEEIMILFLKIATIINCLVIYKLKKKLHLNKQKTSEKNKNILEG